MGTKSLAGAASIGLLIAIVLATIPAPAVAEHTGNPIVTSESYNAQCFVFILVLGILCGDGEASFVLDEIGCDGTHCEADGPPRFGIMINDGTQGDGEPHVSATLTVEDADDNVLIEERFCKRIDSVLLPADADEIIVAVDLANFDDPEPGCRTGTSGDVALSILLPE